VCLNYHDNRLKYISCFSFSYLVLSNMKMKNMKCFIFGITKYENEKHEIYFNLYYRNLNHFEQTTDIQCI
jgi:hypothetical protein